MLRVSNEKPGEGVCQGGYECAGRAGPESFRCPDRTHSRHPPQKQVVNDESVPAVAKQKTRDDRRGTERGKLGLGVEGVSAIGVRIPKGKPPFRIRICHVDKGRIKLLGSIPPRFPTTGKKRPEKQNKADGEPGDRNRPPPLSPSNNSMVLVPNGTCSAINNYGRIKFISVIFHVVNLQTTVKCKMQNRYRGNLFFKPYRFPDIAFSNPFSAVSRLATSHANVHRIRYLAHQKQGYLHADKDHKTYLDRSLS
jgi:hypothetical protein